MTEKDLKKIRAICKKADFCSTCKIGPRNCICDGWTSPDEWSNDEIKKTSRCTK